MSGFHIPKPVSIAMDIIALPWTIKDKLKARKLRKLRKLLERHYNVVPLKSGQLVAFRPEEEYKVDTFCHIILEAVDRGTGIEVMRFEEGREVWTLDNVLAFNESPINYRLATVWPRK